MGSSSILAAPTSVSPLAMSVRIFEMLCRSAAAYELTTCERPGCVSVAHAAKKIEATAFPVSDVNA